MLDADWEVDERLLLLALRNGGLPSHATWQWDTTEPDDPHRYFMLHCRMG